MHGHRFVLSTLLVAVCALALAVASPSRDTGHEVRDIFVSNADGSARRNLTKSNTSDDSPALSPDGRTLAFELQPDRLALISADGRQRRVLLRLDGRSLARPTWSRDGTHIAFTSCVQADCDIGVVRRDGTGLTWIPDASGPTWIAGGRLAFLTDFAPGLRGGPQSLAVSNRDGSNRRVVARTSQVAAHNFLPPVASPSGTRIAFSAYDGAWSLYSLGLEPNAEPLSIADGYRPSWAPSGRRLVFENDSYLWTARADGSRLRRLPRPAKFPHQPSWSPDGTRIAFVTRRAIRPNLFVMNLRTKDLTIVARGVESRLPVWSHDGRRLYYVAGRKS